LALISGAVFVPAAVAQDEAGPTLTIVAPALNVRSGPGVNYPASAILVQGDKAAIIGQDTTSGWWQIQLSSGQTGWVSNGPTYVSVTPVTTDVIAISTNPATSDALPATHYASPETLVFQTATGGPIYAINPDGTNLRYLTNGMDPAISPDGQWVAFTRWATSQDGALGNLWLINVDGTGERVIHEYVLNPRAPVWSPDGTHIAIGMQHGGYVQAREVCGDRRPPREATNISTKRENGKIKFCYTLPPDPYWGLRQINVLTGQYEDLPNDIYSFSPAWDPNYSGRLVYDGDFGLVNLDLYERRTWALTEDFNDHSPIFSPSGGKIAVSYRQDNHWEVHVMNTDGSGRSRLTQTSYQTFVEQELSGQMPHSYNNTAPTWSPDGSQIAFLTDRTGQWEIWVMSADGSNQRPMFPPETLAGITLQYNGVDERMLSWR
jgi:Tol biopolymer transport system component